MVKDMYADLEKIEARGKRKKDKSKGLFSSFGKKDEAEPSSETSQSEPAKPEPAAPVAKPVEAAKPVAEPAPVPKPEPKIQAPPPAPVKVPESVQPKPVPAPQTQPAQQPANSWKPLTGGKLRKAEEDLLTYKKWLNKGYKSGVLTKDQCVSMVHTKEVELGLRPPE